VLSDLSNIVQLRDDMADEKRKRSMKKKVEFRNVIEKKKIKEKVEDV